MRVVEMRQDSELQGLRPAWEALLRDFAPATIFLTWEWVAAWWSAYGRPGELRILVAFDDDGVIRGIAPLRAQEVRRYGGAVQTLSFIGDGSNDSDYLDFIVAVGFEQRVFGAFRAWLAAELKRGAVLRLNEIPGDSLSLPLLEGVAEPQQVIRIESETVCGTVRLPESWENYLAMLRPRFRTKVRSVLRNLETRPEVQFGFCETVEQARETLPVLFELHASRWAREGMPGVFGWEEKRRFYSAVSSLMLERGWLRFSWLKWNGRILACQYGFVYRGAYFQLQEGYEPASEHWNVGIALRAWSIRQFLQEGLREYDFLGGIGRHKTDWGAETKYSKRLVLARKSYRNALFCRGPEWDFRARESVRRMAPEKLLAVRAAYLERRRLAAYQNSVAEDSTDAGGILRAAAQCYFYSPLPALVRALRDRYQLTISRDGGRPKISCSRRTQPSARILCFHRINDDGDAFSPAIPTGVFEQKMRFVARHHTVVGLGELLDRLRDGPPENLLTITFDDGYEDNYRNAFPILQRYGLPATIFLTSGSLDDRQPLWFEQLAQALKTTTKEYIDLEMDIPRRLWLRTPAERLDSHGQVFCILRNLPDEERRRWAPHILRELNGTPRREGTGGMLTWDQVRLMQRHGIDFGGHTVTHPFLSKAVQDQVKWEISECKRRIESELQQPVKHFAYPNGREADISESHKRLIRDAGYRAAVTTIWGVNYASTDPMELRRGGPWEEAPALFACKLDWYQLLSE